MPQPGTPSSASAPRPGTRPLQRGESLPGADLRNAVLRGLDLSASDLRWADLSGADLSGAQLHGARLRGARLAGACLAGVQAHDVDLEAADLAGADLSGADLSGAILLEASLEAASLAGARLARADLRDADLSRADLAATVLDGADLSGAFLGEARLHEVQCRRTRITDVRGLRDAERDALLARGAWQGALAPELAPLVALGGRLVGPGRRWAVGRAARLRASTRQVVASQVESRSSRRAQLQAEAEAARRARLAALPGGPGADLSGQDLHGRHLEEVDWTGARLRGLRLDGAHLRDACLDGADLEGGSLRGARLAGARLRGARLAHAALVDADLRRTDLHQCVLHAADLTGADLRGADLSGADLSGADLTAARLADLDLRTVRLDGAILDQTDLAGARLDGASVVGTDLRGALGLSAEVRAALAEAGARTAEGSLDHLVRGVEARHAAAAIGILALGLGAYMAARLLADDGAGKPGLVAAEEVRTLPPDEALARFEALAQEAVLPPDQVGYLLEASGQARLLGKSAEVERLLRAALAAAGEDVELGAEVRLSLAAHLSEHEGGAEALAVLEPLLDLSRQTNEQRARAMLLYASLAREQGVDPAPRLDAVFDSLGDLHDARAELHLAVASVLANDGDTVQALAHVQSAEALPASDPTVLRIREARARILDRGGDLEGAAATWEQLVAAAEPGSTPHQAAMLALADLRQRQGRLDRARELLEPLVAPRRPGQAATDTRIASRAWLVMARLHEAEGDTRAAAEAYQSTIELARLDPETAEEARLSLARVLGRGDPEVLAGMLAELEPEARAMVEVQARLGEARQALESADPVAARRIYEALSEQGGLDAMTLRDVRTGLGEALAQEGDVPGALVVWRDLLSETARPEDRVHLEVRIAQGLMRGGRLDEAGEAYAALAASTDPDIATQGRLGQAQVQLALGNREQARGMLQAVADGARDPAWRVRALEELADMATQQGDVESALAGWRAVLGAVPPGHAAAARARLAIVSALSAAGRVDEAVEACDEALGGAGNPEERLSARVACAEVLERAQRTDKARDAYAALLVDLRTGLSSASGELPGDVAAGLARTSLALDDPQAALDAAQAGLDLTDDEGIRINLMSLQAAALDALGRPAQAAEVRTARAELVSDIPATAAGVLIEAANQARARGDWDEAVQLMTQARQAQSEAAVRAVIGVELGDVLLEAGRLDEAEAAYVAARDEGGGDALVRFQAGMGLAEAARRAGQPDRAAAQLESLQAPDVRTRRWLLEARARALAEAGDPAAPEAWQELADAAGDDADVLATALRGRADALHAVDRYEEALALYQRAADAAPDPVLAGWSRLGAAASLGALDRPDEAAALLDALRRHRDSEIALQAAIQRSHLAAAAEDWGTAVQVLQGLDAASLGPAWDASLCQARSGALAGAGRDDEASAELDALAARWPGEEEAQVPAWLARAELARQAGAEEDARRYAQQALDAAKDPGFQDQARSLLASLQPD